MCTVTFVPSNGKIILTSNRDEEVERPALALKNYPINGKQIHFPKDPRAGGTWIAADETSNVIVLLNGAAEKHEWNPPYRKSRGLVVLDLIASDSPIASWKRIDLDAIEPFTIVLFESPKLYQLRWDGSQKETVELNANQNYIWSSSTLYPKNIREARAQWFEKFLDTQPNVDENEMFNFHRYTKTDDHQNGLIIDRSSHLKTLSITQAVIQNNKVKMSHFDLAAQHESVNSFLIV